MRPSAERACGAVRRRLDPLLDGDLDRRDEDRLRRHLEACPACREELELARRLRAALRDGLPTLACPPEVTAEVLRRAGQEAREKGRNADRSSRRGWLAALGDRLAAPLDRITPPALSPAASWAAVAALVLLVALLPFAIREIVTPQQPGGSAGGPPVSAERSDATSTGPSGYTDQEVERAERQARLVLAAVAQVGRGAGRTVQDRIIEEALVRPTRRAVASLDDGDDEGAGDGAGRQP